MFKQKCKREIKFLLTLFCVSVFFSCGGDKKSSLIYLYPNDKTQVVSVITDYSNNKRIIAVGKYSFGDIPKNNYIELDISNITKLSDEIGVCWNINNHRWEIVNDKAKVRRIELDTTKYRFNENWYQDEDGIPTPLARASRSCKPQ